MHSINYTLTRGDDEFELDIEYSVAPYDPGCSYGLPENCEPPSGGEIEEMSVVHDGDEFALTPEETEAVEQHIYQTHDYDDGGDYYD